MGEGELEGVEHVAREQGKDGHNQNCFQLLVIRGSAAKVIACRLLGVILDGQSLAYAIRSDVLDSLVAKFAVIHLSPVSCLIGESNLVVARSTPQVVVISHPLTGVHGGVRGRPGTGRCQFPK
jgi:hypothetical protein